MNLEIDAESIFSEKGSILPSDNSARQFTAEPLAGNGGKSGLSAGSVVLNGELNGKDILVISLPGDRLIDLPVGNR